VCISERISPAAVPVSTPQGLRYPERLGEYRVLYDVDDQRGVVQVQIIGEKASNRLIVRGEEYSAQVLRFQKSANLKSYG
jgi:hypothetical protein